MKSLWKICAVWLILRTTVAAACASCGSGGEDPLILYPNEKFKIYQGISSSWDFRNIDADGAESSAGALQRKSAVSLFAGIGLGPRSFVSFGLPVMRSSSDQESFTGIGDPGVSGRYTIIMQNLAEPLLPQIQLILGYKAAFAASTFDSKRSRDLLDAQGSGFDEVRAGVDFWHAMSKWKIGFAQVLVHSLPREFEQGRYAPGLTHKSVASFGYGIGGALRVGVGVLRDFKKEMVVDGATMAGTAQLSHKLFTNADIMLDALTSMRIGYSDHLAMVESYNSFAARQVNVALMRAF